MRLANLSEQVVEIGHKALEMSGTQEFKSTILEDLESLFQAESSVFLDWGHIDEGLRNWEAEDMYFPHWDNSYREMYYDHLRFQDPLFAWLASGDYARSRSVTTLSRQANFRDIKKSELFDELLKPLGCRHIITLALNCGEHLLANISLMRPFGSRDFSQAELHAAELLAPALSGAYRNAQLTTQRDYYRQMMGVVSDHLLDDAVLILSQLGSPVYQSDKFGQKLHEHGFSDTRELLDALRRSERFSKLLGIVDSDSPALAKRLPEKLEETLPTRGRRALHLKIQAMPASMGKTLLCIFLADSVHSAPDTTDLSLREVQVAQLLSAGLSCKQASEKLNISQWTVKNHLKKIYGKLGVNTRAELASLAI